MTTNGINWGASLEDFPTGQWDNFDGTVEMVEYQTGDYNTQIFIMIRPEEYEYAKRGMEYDPDLEPPVRGWYSMGGNAETYQVSEDGQSVVGQQPNKNTRAVRLMFALRDHAGVSLTGGAITPIKGATCHWKSHTENNPRTGEAGRPVLYPVSPPLGEQGGSVVDESLISDAHDLLRAILSANPDDNMRTRDIATKAIEFEEEYKDEVIELVSQKDTIDRAVRAGIITRVDERHIALS
tara:strand:- start:1620 stop:2333 length:714 start_codon:yes stop_codon:yes gene_type:complete